MEKERGLVSAAVFLWLMFVATGVSGNVMDKDKDYRISSVTEEMVSVSLEKKAEVKERLKSLHVPFVKNMGQVDGEVSYYAKTFAGTAFVTKKREIVYSLPSGETGKRGNGDRETKPFSAFPIL